MMQAARLDGDAARVASAGPAGSLADRAPQRAGGPAAMGPELRGDPVGEREVALGLMGRQEYLETPELVTLRQGFSLLDLERYVEGRGYRGRPLGGLEYADLPGLAPLIVAIEEGSFAAECVEVR